MRTTDFAGLTVLAPGEPLSTDGYSFQARNPDSIDKLLKVGALTHRHDEHAAVATPTNLLTGAVLTSGGSFPSGITAAFGYTCIDGFGGETLMSDLLELAMPPKLATPVAPTAVADYTAGSMLAGTYQYVMTYTDGAGGETTPSPVTTVVVDPGHANAQITFSGLNTAMPAGAAGWRLYKSARGSSFLFVGEGAGAAFTDDGLVCADCTGPVPRTNTTLDRNRVQVVAPGVFPAGAVSFRLYGTLGDGFSSPSFFGEYSIATNAGATFTFASFNPGEGEPPVVATAIGGAHRIDPESEITNFHWRTPVANAAALPALGNSRGDVRVTLDDLTAHVWNSSGGGSWDAFGGGGGGGGGGAWAHGTVTVAGLADGASANFSINLAVCSAIYRVRVDPARLRLYRKATARTSDAARPFTTPPAGDHGVILDVETVTGEESFGINPVAIAMDEDDLTSNTILGSITNMYGATHDFVIDVYYRTM